MAAVLQIDPLVRRMLPAYNPDSSDRAHGWSEWLAANGSAPLLKFIRWANGTRVEDEEILQETLIVAFVKIEQGAYTPREVPFSAFLKKIAWYKIMEASRRGGDHVSLDALPEDCIADEGFAHDRVDGWREEEALLQALNRLPPRRSRIVMLYEYGYSTAEIAAKLGIRETLVRKEKSLGLRQTLLLAG